MHITVVPGGAQTTRTAIQHILDSADGHSVRAVFRDPSKASASFVAHPRYTAVRGDFDDGANLDFSGSDAVLVMTPARYDGYDSVKYAREVSEKVKAAVKAAGSVKRVVLLSSMGAQYAEGVGEIKTNHAAEEVLKDAAPEVVFVRATYFMENWGMALPTILGDDSYFDSTVTPLDFKMPMVSVADIGRTLAAEVLSTGEKLPATPYAFDLLGPGEYSSLDVQKAFEEALGKKIAVRPVENANLDGFYAQMFPPTLAPLFAEMNRSFLPGGILYKNASPTGAEKKGQVELVDAIKQMLAQPQ